MEGVIEVEQTVELSPEERIQRYLDVISTSTDPEEVRAVDNLYSSVFNTDPPWTRSWEDFTSRVELLLDDDARKEADEKVNAIFIENGSSLRAVDANPAVELPHTRVGAIVHLVRSMIQGNNDYPVDKFQDVLERAVGAMLVADPDLTEDDAMKYLRAEIRDVWEPHKLQSGEERQRAEAAHRLVSGPYRHRITQLGMGALRGAVAGFGPRYDECAPDYEAAE